MILSKSGLLEITMKTAELMRQNQQLNKELKQLKKETQDFVQSVLSNPENAKLKELSKSPSNDATMIFVSSSLDFQLVNEVGQLKHIPTVCESSDEASSPTNHAPVMGMAKVASCNKKEVELGPHVECLHVQTH